MECDMKSFYLKGIKAARKASLLSNSYGRTVGVAILSESGQVISEGSSVVIDKPGNIDLSLIDSKDCFDKRVEDNIFNLIQHLSQIGIVPSNQVDEIVKFALKNQEMRSLQASSPVLNFSKTIHAELSALISAPSSLLASTALFSTLEPCANCLKYIQYSGVSKVYYLEHNGYSKPLGSKISSIDLYEISIS